MEDALNRPGREKWSGAVIFYTQRPFSVISSVRHTLRLFFLTVFDIDMRDMLNIVVLMEAARPTIYLILLLKLAASWSLLDPR
jgi:hypothetical protein